MSSNHLILCHPLLLLPSIFPTIRVFSNELVLHIRWPKYWSFSFSITTSNEYSGLISFRMDWFDLLAVQGTLLWSLKQVMLKFLTYDPWSQVNSFCRWKSRCPQGLSNIPRTSLVDIREASSSTESACQCRGHWSLVQEDPTCCRAAKPVCYSYWACMPRACAPATREARSCPHLLQMETTHTATKIQCSQK